MNMLKKFFCLVFLGFFLICLLQIRTYKPEILKYSDHEEVVSSGKLSPEGKQQAFREKRNVDIVVDPGHGGIDGGTTGGGVQEKRWALRLGHELAKELRARGLDVMMTREEDKALSLDRRCQVANASDAKAFVSIHFNYSHKPSVSGFETYYSWPKSLATMGAIRRSLGVSEGVTFRDQRGELLARKIQKAVVADMKVRDRGARNSQFWVTRNTKAPSVLLECGFLSNQAEREDYENSAYRLRVVTAISNALEAYLEEYKEAELKGIELQ